MSAWVSWVPCKLSSTSCWIARHSFDVGSRILAMEFWMPSTSTGIKSVRVGGPEQNQTALAKLQWKNKCWSISILLRSLLCLSMCFQKKERKEKKGKKKLAAHSFVANSYRRSLHAEVLSQEVGVRSYGSISCWESDTLLAPYVGSVRWSCWVRWLNGFFVCGNSSNKLWVGYAQVPWTKLRGQKDNIKFSQFSHLTEYCTYTCYYSVDVHF